MKRLVGKYGLLMILGVLIVMLAGCSGEKDAQQQPPAEEKQGEQNQTDQKTDPVEKKADPTPVTLKLMQYGLGDTEEFIQQIFAEPIKAKYPHITIEYDNSVNLADALASRESIPDIVWTDYPWTSGVLDFAFPMDLNEMLKKNNVDLSQLEPSSLEGIRNLGKNGELYGLPFYLDKYMIFYNKEIFDRFALGYPTDDMTFEELVTLSKRLTLEQDGVQYYGYRWANMYINGYTLGLPVIDEHTGKANFQTDGWKYALSFVKQLIDMGIDNKVTGDQFIKDHVVAMYPQTIGYAFSQLSAADVQMDWDMIAMPYPADKPKDYGRPAWPMYLMVSSVSKHQEEAVAAITHASTSKEAQMQLSQRGQISVLRDAEVEQQFGKLAPFLEGKNIAGLFKYPFGKLPYTTIYDSTARGGLNQAPIRVLEGDDMNSALRFAEELANQKIDEFLQSRTK